MHIVQIKNKRLFEKRGSGKLLSGSCGAYAMYPIPKPKSEIPLTLWALISCSDPFALMMQLLQLFGTDLERSVTS